MLFIGGKACSSPVPASTAASAALRASNGRPLQRPATLFADCPCPGCRAPTFHQPTTPPYCVPTLLSSDRDNASVNVFAIGRLRYPTMESLAALGVAASAVQFVTFASSLVSNTIQISGSAAGATKQVLSMESVYRELAELASALTTAQLRITPLPSRALRTQVGRKGAPLPPQKQSKSCLTPAGVTASSSWM